MEITKELLIHWWHYYGGLLYTLQELKDFEEIIDKFGVQKVFDFVTWSYICADGKNTVLLCAMRSHKVDLIFSNVPDPLTFDPDAKTKWDKAQEFLLKQFKETSNS